MDGTKGNFAGNVVGLDYTWQDLNNGVEILDYSGVGDCDQYIGCLPVDEHIYTYTVITLTTPTDVPSRTATWSTTQNTLSNMIDTDDPLTYSASDGEEIVGTITLTDCPFDDTIVISTTTTVEDTDYVVSTRQITRSSYITETSTLPDTTIETDGQFTITDVTTTTEYETVYEELVTTYTDYEIIDGTTHIIEATTTTTVAVLEPVTKSDCTQRTRTYYTGCESVNTCSGTECIESSETSDETSDINGHHTYDHDHKHKHKHHHKHKGDDDDEDDDDDDEDDDEDWKDKHKGHKHDKDEECDEDGDDDDSDDYEGKHEGHHHGKDEECNEGGDDDYEKKHEGHHHGKDEECNEE